MPVHPSSTFKCILDNVCSSVYSKYQTMLMLIFRLLSLAVSLDNNASNRRYFSNIFNRRRNGAGGIPPQAHILVVYALSALSPLYLQSINASDCSQLGNI